MPVAGPGPVEVVNWHKTGTRLARRRVKARLDVGEELTTLGN